MNLKKIFLSVENRVQTAKHILGINNPLGILILFSYLYTNIFMILISAIATTISRN